jgi:hypothetical protein
MRLFNDHKDFWYLIEGETPKFVAGWEDLQLQIYFPSDNTLPHILPSKVYAAINEQDWCGIISHIAKETSKDKVSIAIPANYRRYNVLVGGGSSHRINVAKEIKAFEEDTSIDRYTKGYIYSASNGTEYTPDEILVPNTIFFERPLAQSMVSNDCSTHTFNYLFRHPVFTMREQVHRLALRNVHKKKETTDERKKKGGYSLKIFNDFIVKDGLVYYLEELHALDIEG